jgi:hypothetical protein
MLKLDGFFRQGSCDPKLFPPSIVELQELNVRSLDEVPIPLASRIVADTVSLCAKYYADESKDFFVEGLVSIAKYLVSRLDPPLVNGRPVVWNRREVVDIETIWRM